MQGGGTTGGDQNAVLDVIAIVCRVDARGIGHVLVDNLDDSGSAGHGVDRHAAGDVFIDSLSRTRGIECHASAREGVRVELAEQQVPWPSP